MMEKDGKHDLTYGFAYFDIGCDRGKARSMKQMFNITTLEVNECIPIRESEKSKSIVANLIDAQTGLREELDAMTVVVAEKNVEIVVLKTTSVKKVRRE